MKPRIIYFQNGKMLVSGSFKGDLFEWLCAIDYAIRNNRRLTLSGTAHN